MTAIVILGAAVWADGPSPTLRRRTSHGAALFHAGDGALVVVCGGMGQHPPSEAAAMADILRAKGIPQSAIRLEDRSTNTAENIAFANDILMVEGVRDVILVSDAYHLPRARLLAKRHALGVRTSAPPRSGARVWPQVKGWLREGPAILAVVLRLR